MLSPSIPRRGRRIPLPFFQTLICGTLLVGSLSFLSAATINWTGGGGNGNWTTTSNWSGGTPPGSTSGASADTANFNSNPTNRTVVVDAGRNIGALTFANGAGSFTIGTTSGDALVFYPRNGASAPTYSLQLSGTASAQTINAPLILRRNNSTNAGGDQTFINNATALTSTFTLGGSITVQNPLVPSRILILDGSNKGDNTITGVIQEEASIANPGNMGLEKKGTGKWILTATNTYSGATTVSGGTLVINGAGSINNTSGITVNGGTLNYSSSVAMTQPLTFTSGTLAGTNYTGKTLSIGTNQTLSPGNSTGTLSSGSQTWASGGTYAWELNDTAGTAGGTGWDLLDITGNLTLTATAGNKFNFVITSLNGSQVAGATPTFDSLQSYAWLVADATNAISGFDADAFLLNLSGFQNGYTGNWSVAQGGSAGIGGDSSQVYLVYTAIPEPSSALLFAFGGMVGLFRRRLFRR